MASTKNMTIETGTVETGQGSSPNNTITEISDLENKDQNILFELNPYLLSASIVRDNTVLKLDSTGQKTYKVPNVYSHDYELRKIAVKTGVSAANLIQLNKTVLGTNSCFDAGNDYVISIGSLTNKFELFAAEKILVTKTGFSVLKGTFDNFEVEKEVKLSKVTLENIALEHSVDINKLKEYNSSITDQTAIIPEQTLLLTGITSTTNGNTVAITDFGLNVGTSRGIFIRWEWDYELYQTDGFEIKWTWQSADGKWHAIDIKTQDNKEYIEGNSFEDSVTADSSAIAIKVTVRPITENGDSNYSWSTEQTHYFMELASVTPQTPTVEIKKYKLIASLENLDNSGVIGITHVEFDVTRDDVERINKLDSTAMVPLSNNLGYIYYECKIEPGHRYKVRARTFNDIFKVYSGWSQYSDRGDAIPTAPILTEVKALSESSVRLTWSKVDSADSYEIEYAPMITSIYIDNNCSSAEEYLRMSGVDLTTETVEADTESTDSYVSHTIINMATGSDYFIRVRAVNDTDNSEWSEAKLFTIGKKPSAPTTWSSRTNVSVGEPLKLYWVHNAEDGSVETKAEVRLIVDGVEQLVTVVKSTDPEERDETSYYKIDTEAYDEGSKIDWQVRTAGVYKENEKYVYGDWSMERTVEIYAPPVLSVTLENHNGDLISDMLSSLPLKIKMETGNTNNQKPTGFYVSVIADNSYNTVDNVGNNKSVSAGSAIFSKYYNAAKSTSDESPEFTISDNLLNAEVILSAEHLNLENNYWYHVVCTVAMSSGLRAETTTYGFKIGWSAKTYIPFAEVNVDKETLTASIRPYSNGKDNVLLSVYRREYDGTFTELTTEIVNGRNTYLVDPHPALDYARYRVVAKDIHTGAVNYNDIPGVPVKEKAVIIQWDETWQNFDVTDDGETDERPYSGSMLRLPYNIDVSNDHKQDVSLINYIGRRRPVSYYGTQLGETATWNMVIPKSDKETLYALRRLAIWMGDVYVREPSGSGYWANITVNFSQKHLDLTIPISISVTPVEGGV